jgi:hypothetical protein
MPNRPASTNVLHRPQPSMNVDLREETAAVQEAVGEMTARKGREAGSHQEEQVASRKSSAET